MESIPQGSPVGYQTFSARISQSSTIVSCNPIKSKLYWNIRFFRKEETPIFWGLYSSRSDRWLSFFLTFFFFDLGVRGPTLPPFPPLFKPRASWVWDLVLELEEILSLRFDNLPFFLDRARISLCLRGFILQPFNKTFIHILLYRLIVITFTDHYLMFFSMQIISSYFQILN